MDLHCLRLFQSQYYAYKPYRPHEDSVCDLSKRLDAYPDFQSDRCSDDSAVAVVVALYNPEAELDYSTSADLLKVQLWVHQNLHLH